MIGEALAFASSQSCLSPGALVAGANCTAIVANDAVILIMLRRVPRVCLRPNIRSRWGSASGWSKFS